MTEARTISIRKLESVNALKAAWDVMKQLRPHLDLEQFLNLYAEAREEGYRLVGLFDSQELKCVAGYRFMTMLVYGKSLYVDDLVTTENGRSSGYGRLMLQWLEREAMRLKCSELHLDSGVQRERAHRFYFAQGMTIKGYHFTRPLP